MLLVMTLGNGATEELSRQIDSVGSSLVIVVPGSSRRDGIFMGSGSVHSLSCGDVDAIARHAKSVKYVAGMYGQSGQVIFGNKNVQTRISGVSEFYFSLRGWNLTHGRFFSPHDDSVAAKICVLGSKVKDKLIGMSDPLGAKVRIQNTPFTVVGVLESKGQSYSGEDQDDVVFVPLKTAQMRLFGVTIPREVRIILALSRNPTLTENTVQEIDSILTKKHKIGPSREKDFTVRSLNASQGARKQSLRTMTVFLILVSAISLVVGSVGVMNIMFVSVSERVREIGVRLAVGAKQKDILAQFLTESLFLTLLGGVMGLLLGMCSAFIASNYFKWAGVLYLSEILLTVLVSALIGLIAGVLPAWKASRMNPVDALRVSD